MKMEFIPCREELKPFVHLIWTFESPVGMPASDANLAAPNGCPKLILNCENSIVSVVDGRVQESREHALYFIGTREGPALLRTNPGKTSFIGVEFYPFGAYPIFGIPMTETANGLWLADDLMSKWGRNVCETIRSLCTMREKTDFLQARLVNLLNRKTIRNTVVEYSVSTLKETNGLTTISELEWKTGYTRRYLEMLFKEHVGLSPKVLSGIFRFQKFYRKWARNIPYDRVKDDLYDYYYDQAHFAKEFKRMTGYSPRRFQDEVSNEFGRQLLLR